LAFPSLSVSVGYGYHHLPKSPTCAIYLLHKVFPATDKKHQQDPKHKVFFIDCRLLVQLDQSHHLVQLIVVVSAELPNNHIYPETKSHSLLDKDLEGVIPITIGKLGR
jgi:hypothetical protein